MAAQLSFGILAKGSAVGETNGGFHIVQVANGNWYAFTFMAGAGDQSSLSWAKSTDKGRTWGIPTFVCAGQSFSSVWYDRWTPGDSGDLIHVIGMDSNNDDVLYANIDTSSDTTSSTTTVFNGASFFGFVYCTLVKTRAGNLYVTYNGDGGTETGHYVAASPFTSWTSKSNPNEAAASDDYAALPGNYADSDDYDLYFGDTSANEWSRKTYDASANSWSESVLVAGTGFAESATMLLRQAVALRVSDGMQFAFGWNAFDSATGDLVGFKFDGTTSTALTNVVTNADDCACVAATYDESADRLYVFYFGKSDGSETITSDVGVYYKYSDDDGSTWSAEQTLFNHYLDDFRWIDSPPTVASLNVAPPVIWYNDDTDVVLTTAENPDTGGGGGGTSGGWWGS